MLLQTLLPQLDPLTEQQLVGICNLKQSSQQAEEALSQGLDQLHQSLADTMADGRRIADRRHQHELHGSNGPCPWQAVQP